MNPGDVEAMARQSQAARRAEAAGNAENQSPFLRSVFSHENPPPELPDNE
jgi:hypothetical protein